jgi:plastocyanin
MHIRNQHRLGPMRGLSLLAIVLFSAQFVVEAAAAPSTVIVKMLDRPPSFDPKTITIPAGATVEWQNVGNSVHNTTDDHHMALAEQT